MDIKDAYTTQELTEPLGYKTKQAVLDRASREGWQSRPRTGRGGGKEWLLSSMPEKTRLLIATRVCPQATPEPITPRQEASLATVATLSGQARTRAEARAAVIGLYRMFTVNSGLAPTPAAGAFVIRWNAGEIAAETWICEMLPTICRNSLLNWEKTVKSEGVARLAGNYGIHRKDTGFIEGQLVVQETVLGMLGEHPHTSAQIIFERLKALNWRRQHPEKPDEQPLLALKIPTLRRLQQWLANWKKENEQVFQFIKAPDKWRGRFLASCGDMYELITRYNQRWEFDGTPSDIMLSDNQRYVIIGVINIYSRELKLEVVPRSTAVAVTNLFRRALIDWGVPEEAVTDNGKEFVSTHVQQIGKRSRGKPIEIIDSN